MTDLRGRQRALARQAIVDACAELVSERHHLDFLMKEVADRAGVSLRTVYNHFATREDLLDELGKVLDQQMRAAGGADADDLRTPDDLLAAVRANLTLFDELGGISEAFAQMPLVDVGRDEERATRTRLITEFLAAQMPSAPAEDAHALALVLRHLISHRSWFWLTREYGLDTDTVIRVLGWTITTLLDAAESGQGPSSSDASSPTALHRQRSANRPHDPGEGP